MSGIVTGYCAVYIWRSPVSFEWKFVFVPWKLLNLGKELIMPQLITYGSELIRINPSYNRIEYSTNRGASWVSRYSGNSCGSFRDLLPYNGKIIAITDKGVYCSSNKGASWISRYTGSTAKSFVAIQDAGREILAQTSDGHLYFSTNEGASWIRRR